MQENSLFKKGLLYLLYSVSLADGVHDKMEKIAIENIRKNEKIPQHIYKKFMSDINVDRDEELYRKGITSILKCGRKEKVRAMAWVHKLIEADGHFHIKEARFLLYSIAALDIDVDEVMNLSQKLPEISS